MQSLTFCSVMSHVVYFAYRIVFNISRQRRELQTFYQRSYTVNLSALYNASKKTPRSKCRVKGTLKSSSRTD